MSCDEHLSLLLGLGWSLVTSHGHFAIIRARVPLRSYPLHRIFPIADEDYRAVACFLNRAVRIGDLKDLFDDLCAISLLGRGFRLRVGVITQDSDVQRLASLSTPAAFHVNPATWLSLAVGHDRTSLLLRVITDDLSICRSRGCFSLLNPSLDNVFEADSDRLGLARIDREPRV